MLLVYHVRGVGQVELPFVSGWEAREHLHRVRGRGLVVKGVHFKPVGGWIRPEHSGRPATPF